MGSAVSRASAARVGAEPERGDDDDRLVVAVRRGDDRAFEALYVRYHRRIAAYVLSVVKDRGRAEDVTQEVFLSVYRGLRASDGPIAFGPWVYGIARNACIDHFRRSQRGEEVSLNLDVAENLVGWSPTPDAALLAKQNLDHLRGAFGGLSDMYHEVLVLRELEGLSYGEIGERMGMSRAAVETALFRARRRLAEEYEELATGARCARIQDSIALAVEARLHVRESRKLARHVAHCQPCRREALAAGIDSSLLAHVPLRRHAAAKIAALFPFPALARSLRGRGAGDETAVSLAGSPGGGLAPLLSEQFYAGWTKVAAIVAVVVAGGAAGGVGTKHAFDRDETAPAQTRPAPERSAATAEAAGAGRLPVGGARIEERGAVPTRGRDRGGRDADRSSDRSEREREREPATHGGGGGGGGTGATGEPAPRDSPAGSGVGAGGASGGDHAATGGGSGTNEGAGGGEGGGTSPKAPATDPPASGGTSQPLKPVVDGVANTVDTTVEAVEQTVTNVTQGVGQTVAGVNQTVGGVNETVGGVTEGVGQTVQDTTQGLDDVVEGVGGILRPRR